MPDATRERLGRFWNALNRRRRPGTFWIEFGVLFVVLSAWMAFTLFVYTPDRTGPFAVLGWFLVAYVPYWAWVIWYRSRGREEPVGEPPASTSVVVAPGMVDPMQWHAEWVQRRRDRWRSRSYRVLWFSIATLTGAIFFVGVLNRVYLLVAMGALIGAGLGRDWWRYSPYSGRAA